MGNISQIGLNLLKQNLNPRKDELILSQLPQIKQFTIKQIQTYLKPQKEKLGNLKSHKENVSS